MPDYLDAFAFLSVLTADGEYNAGWTDTKYDDELVWRANSEADPSVVRACAKPKRMSCRNNVTHYSIYFLCKPYVKNLVPNPLNQPDWRRVYIDSTITAKSLGS